MGGGPSQWAAEAHVKAGFPLYATPDAARSFNDDLEIVQASGIRIVEEDELHSLPDSVLRLELRDYDFRAIANSLEYFGVSLHDLAAVAVAVPAIDIHLNRRGFARAGNPRFSFLKS